MKKHSKLNIADKIKDFKMCYTIDEFKKSLNELTETNSGVFSNNKRAWFLKNEKPKIMKDIDSQLRIAFNINANTKPVFCVYYPPNDKSISLTIKDKNPNVLNRVVISTINEIATVSFTSAEEKINIRNWTAYYLPDITSSYLTLTFDNNKIMKTLERKGHRSKKTVKNIESRYIIVVDYLADDNEIKKMSNNLLNTLQQKITNLRV